MNHSRINPSNLCNPCEKKISENIHTEPVQEYLNMDKITLVKMLHASKEENKKLHDKLDKLREEAQEREAKAEARNEELMRANRRQMEYQVKQMDQLTEVQRQLNKTNDHSMRISWLNSSDRRTSTSRPAKTSISPSSRTWTETRMIETTMTSVAVTVFDRVRFNVDPNIEGCLLRPACQRLESCIFTATLKGSLRL